MTVLIVEDEKIAADHLAKLVGKYAETFRIIARMDSVKRTVEYLRQQPPPDLILMDIHLADGNCFEIFEQVSVESPIIFTTAYDQYAVKAFKVNSLDYLLKPINPDELDRALSKFERLRPVASPAPVIPPELLQRMIGEMGRTAYKERFLVKVGERLKTIQIADIQCFYSWQKGTFIQARPQRFAIDFTLDQVEELVDPAQFFRVSRKHLVRLEGIRDIVAYSGNRLLLLLDHPTEEEILVSREKVNSFKEWLDR